MEINYHKEKGVKNCLYSLPVTIITVEKFFQSGPMPKLELNRVFHGNKYCLSEEFENSMIRRSAASIVLTFDIIPL